MYLFFDTETTGLDSPKLVQLAYILSDENGRIIEQDDFIVKPYGFEIPADAVKLHGITTEIAKENGISLEMTLENFTQVLNRAKFVVAHNIAFDLKVMELAFHKNGKINLFESKKKVCTANDIKTVRLFPNFMRKITNRQSLSNLYYNLFNEKLANAHTATADTFALYKCFLELKSKNLI